MKEKFEKKMHAVMKVLQKSVNARKPKVSGFAEKTEVKDILLRDKGIVEFLNAGAKDPAYKKFMELRSMCGFESVTGSSWAELSDQDVLVNFMFKYNTNRRKFRFLNVHVPVNELDQFEKTFEKLC